MALCFCQKCHRTMDEKQFYTYRDGKKTELCKKCMTMHVNPEDTETFLYLLKKLDRPWIPSEWKNTMMKSPGASGAAIFGKYLSKMRINQFNKYGYADSEIIQQEIVNRMEASQEQYGNYEEHLREELEAGEISEEQYSYLLKGASGGPQIHPEPVPLLSPFAAMEPSEDIYSDIENQLTKEDVIYLSTKWGQNYKPHEWVELERKYQEMSQSFEIKDSDTIGSLILICKTYLKMNNAIDIADVDAYQKLSRTYDLLRKSAKFTAAQNKEEEQNKVDSVGKIVEICERLGGAIPEWDLSVDRDIVDTVIRDMKNYTHELITSDPTISRQIEDYLKKKEILEEERKDKAALADGENYELTDKDIAEYNRKREELRKEDDELDEFEEPT